ncbi:Protein of unknown function (DUF3752) [Fragilaria crotonensis]|nr:Protein of unknown function (DUF3752) [Fragilaria crotonensis]
MGRHKRHSDENDDRVERRKTTSRRDERSDDDDDSTDKDRKKRKKETKTHKHRSESRGKKSRKRAHYSASGSESIDTEDSRRREKKYKKKKEGKKDKKKRRDREPTTKDGDANDPMGRNFIFADALHELLDEHPSLSSDLPVMLIRMASGASFDLSQMSDVGAAQGLARVFQTLQMFGVERDGNSWKWKAPIGGPQGRNNDLLLLQISRSMLDQIGFTMDAVESYGKREPAPQIQDEQNPKQFPQPSEFTPLQKQTLALIDRFVQMDATLPNQLGELCNMILSGESVAVDGLPDENLRDSLEKLFRGAGLTKSEMEDEDEDADDDETTTGFGLPETNDHFARINMEYILAACKHRAAAKQDEAPRRVVRGPLPLHMADQYPSHSDRDDDDEDGPVPAGMQKARNGQSKEMVRAMAELRQQELEGVISDHAYVAKPGEREEWMINPGEHDLLQGIKSGGMKNRNFENRKASDNAQREIPIDPSVQAEVDAIIQAHREARGPTLIDQHRAKAAAEKANKEKESNPSFGWSREKDLDAGRRVDKDALRLLMGGAGGGLSDKFQGGFNKE